MSDPNTWQVPGFIPPQAAPPSAPQQPFLPPGGWVPPPKPGLIPLRPLTLGTILSASFQVMRRNPRPTFGFSLAINAAIVVFTGLVAGSWIAFAISRVSNAAPSDQGDIIAGSLLGGGLSLLVPLAGSIAVAALLQGVIAMEVARGTLGEKLTTGALLKRARGRIGALIGWTFLVIGAVLVFVTVVSIIVALLIAFGGTAGLVAGILLAVFIGLAFLVVAVWIGTKVSLVPSILMLERMRLFPAIARSWSLTNRSFWKTFGIQLLVQVIISVATQVISTPISFVFGILGAVLAPTGDAVTSGVIVGITYGVLILVSLFTSAISSVMTSSTTALIYIDIRMRKEGLDLELMHFVEARQAGDASVTDPYLVPPGGTAAAPGARA